MPEKTERPDRPKKHLGQHFLKDGNYISKIIETAEVQKEDLIVEIGPGKGALTFRLAELAGEVIAIELDHALCETLKEQAASYPNLTIVEADALRFPYERIETRFKVVANLPYYISTPILFRLIELRNQITSMTIMVQKEVANRVVASPDSKDYGVLSIGVQFYAVPSIAFKIPPGAFYPPPEVDSAVLKIVPRERPAVEIKNEPLFWAIIKSAFSHRRKTILNSLSMAGFHKDIITRILEQAGIDPSMRPEDLSMEKWGKIVDFLFEHLEDYQKYRKGLKF